VVTPERARGLALSLPEAVEQDHHGFPSYRVGGKIFATHPEPGLLRVMADPEVIATAAEENPSVCARVYWGESLSAVAIDLASADPGLVEELLLAGWSRRAPARLRSG
jgi:hypothetical protein